MQDRTRRALRQAGHQALKLLVLACQVVVLTAAIFLTLFCLGWWVLG